MRMRVYLCNRLQQIWGSGVSGEKSTARKIMSLLKAAVGNAYEWICESGEWPANWLNLAKGQFVYLNFNLFAFLKMNSGCRR